MPFEPPTLAPRLARRVPLTGPDPATTGGESPVDDADYPMPDGL